MSEPTRRVDSEGFVLLAERTEDGSAVAWRLIKELLISGPPVYGNDWSTGADDPWQAGESEWCASGRVTPDGCMDWKAGVHHCAPAELQGFAAALGQVYPTCLSLLEG